MLNAIKSADMFWSVHVIYLNLFILFYLSWHISSKMGKLQVKALAHIS